MTAPQVHIPRHEAAAEAAGNGPRKRECMSEVPETIILTAPDTGEEIELYILEETSIAGVNYLLAAEAAEADCDAWILRKVSEQGEDAIYEFVEDDTEFDAIARVFEETLEDIGIER